MRWIICAKMILIGHITSSGPPLFSYMEIIGVAEGGSRGSEEPPLGGSNRARKRRPVLPVAHV